MIFNIKDEYINNLIGGFEYKQDQLRALLIDTLEILESGTLDERVGMKEHIIEQLEEIDFCL